MQNPDLVDVFFRVNPSQSVETVMNPKTRLHKCTETDPITCFNATIDSPAAIWHYCTSEQVENQHFFVNEKNFRKYTQKSSRFL